MCRPRAVLWQKLAFWYLWDNCMPKELVRSKILKNISEDEKGLFHWFHLLIKVYLPACGHKWLDCHHIFPHVVSTRWYSILPAFSNAFCILIIAFTRAFHGSFFFHSWFATDAISNCTVLLLIDIMSPTHLSSISDVNSPSISKIFSMPYHVPHIYIFYINSHWIDDNDRRQMVCSRLQPRSSWFSGFSFQSCLICQMDQIELIEFPKTYAVVYLM